MARVYFAEKPVAYLLSIPFVLLIKLIKLLAIFFAWFGFLFEDSICSCCMNLFLGVAMVLEFMVALPILGIKRLLSAIPF